MTRPRALRASGLGGVSPPQLGVPLSRPRVVRGEGQDQPCREREFFIDNLLVQIHFIIVMIRWTGLKGPQLGVPLHGARVVRGEGEHQPCTSSQYKNEYFTEVCSGSEEGSYLRLIDFCITQL